MAVDYPYLTVTATQGSPNTDMYTTVTMRLTGYPEGMGLVEADLIQAVKDYLLTLPAIATSASSKSEVVTSTL